MKIQSFLLPAIALVVGSAFSGCANSKFVGITSNELAAHSGAPRQVAIQWPDDYAPSQAVFHVHNEIEIRAAPDVVWDILTQADAWPSWYQGATDVKVQGGEGGELAPGAVISWRTMGLQFDSHVREFAPPFRLAWEGRKPVIRGYHAWLLVPTADGCRVITAESFHGFLGYMQRAFIPNKLHGLHDTWLRELKRKAEARAAKSQVAEPSPAKA